MTNKYLPYIAGLFTSIFFGLTFIFTSKALGVLSPLEIPAARFLLASVFITILYLLKVVKLDYKNKPIKKLLLLAICQPFLYFIFETYGIELTNASLSGVMIALIPVVVLIFSYFILKNTPTKKQGVCVLLSVVGAIIVVFSSSSSGSGSGIEPVGFLYLIGAVITASLFNILSKDSSKEFSPVEITFFMMWFACIVFNVINFTFGRGFEMYSSLLSSQTGLSSILYLGICASVMGFLCCNYMLANLSVPSGATFTNLVTVVSVFGGVLINGESFNFIQGIGIIIILIGVFAINTSKTKVGKENDLKASGE